MKTIFSKIMNQTSSMRELLLRDRDTEVSDVSGWSVHQHLSHLLKAGSRIMQQILAEAPVGPSQPTLLGRFVLVTGWIPRGRGKAPSGLEGEKTTAPLLLSALDQFEQQLRQTSSQVDLSETAAIARHPYFGPLNRAQWLRFIFVHNKHHLKIITEILANQSST